MKEFLITNWYSIIATSGGVIAFVWGIIERIRGEKLKSKLELEKDKNLLNDKKFREAYENFISLMFDLMAKKKKNLDIEGGILDFMKKTLLFAGPETIKKFGLYRKEAGSGDSRDVIPYLENLIFAMRKDLGVSNDSLKQYDIIQTFIVGNAKEELGKINKS